MPMLITFNPRAGTGMIMSSTTVGELSHRPSICGIEWP